MTVASVREIIDESLDLLKNRSIVADSPELASKLESVRSVLIRNEKKIWLRTKKGRGMLAEIGTAAESLRGSLRSLGEIGAVDTAISNLEALSSAIDEESRKRSMVVT